ncbi:hypothetical protein NUM3379_41770 [Kineococcus sp. NUM-3379]
MLAALAVLTALLCTPPVWAAFSASVPTASPLTVSTTFPDHPTAVKQVWDASAATPGYTTASAKTKLEVFHRGQDATSTTSGGAAADDSGQSRPGTYDAATDGPSLWWQMNEFNWETNTNLVDTAVEPWRGVYPRAGGVRGAFSTVADATSGVKWVQGPGPSWNLAYDLGSPNAAYLEGTGPAVDTSRSFTVSAWVRTGVTAAVKMAAVSQDGRYVSSFYLGTVDSTSSRWGFAMTNGDTRGNPGYSYARMPVDASDVGKWVHLIGVWDAPTRTQTLYVKRIDEAGDRTNSATRTQDSWYTRSTPSVPCQCSVNVGRARYDDGYSDLWQGAVDDVRVFPRALDVSTAAARDRIRTDPRTSRWTFEDVPTPPNPVINNSTNPPSYTYTTQVPSGTTTGDGVVTTRTASLGTAMTFVGVNGTNSGDEHALYFSAPSSTHLTGPNTVVDTAASFSVAVNVHMRSADNASCSCSRQIVSQDARDGSNVLKGPAFTLGRVGNAWEFSMPQALGSSTPNKVTANWSTTPHPDGWVHLVAVHDAAAKRISLYVDGYLASSSTYATTAWSAPGNLQIGRRANDGASTYGHHFTGTVDDITTFNYPLSLPDVRDERRGRGELAPSPFGELGARTLGALGSVGGTQKEPGATATGAATNATTAVAFAGSSHLSNGTPFYSTAANATASGTTPTPPNVQAFSVAFWFRAGSHDGGSLVGLSDSTTNQWGANLGRQVFLDDCGAVNFTVNTGSLASPVWRKVATPARLDAWGNCDYGFAPYRDHRDGAWHHVVATLGTARGMNLYVDGVETVNLTGTGAVDTTAETNATATTSGVAYSGAGHWRWGGTSLSGSPSVAGVRNSYFSGLLDEMAVFSRELTRQDVLWQYHANH